MKMSSNNFLYVIKDLVMGDTALDGGYLTDVPIPLSAFEANVVRTLGGTGAAGDPVVEAGAHIVADETNARVVKVEEAIDTVGHLTVPVPRDYDEALDTLKIRVLASQILVSTDNDVELDSELYVKVPGTALSADKNPPAPGTILATTEAWIEFDLSGFGLKRDNVATFKLITNGANDTDGEEVLIHAIEMTYRSTLVSYNSEDSSGTSLR